jgi:uncharacterized membrane protein
MSQRASTRMSIMAIFTALTTVVTMVFSVYVPQTRGFFNIGETMVFTSAILFGPFVGTFSGGVGSMLADFLLGYPHYALATLIIKACEGGVVGFLAQERLKVGSRIQWKAFTFAVGLVTGILLGGIGSFFYTGSVNIYLGIPPPQSPTLTFFIPQILWYALGGLVLFLITLMGFVFEPSFGWLVFAAMSGGAIMVSGYFIYQQFFLGPLFNISVIASAEIPINIGQMIVGLIIAIPLVRTIRRSMPSLKI